MKKIKYLIIAFICIGLATLLTACGFSLRSASEFPPQMHHLYLKTSVTTVQFNNQLRMLLQGMDVELVKQPGQAPFTLNIEKAQFIAPQLTNIATTVVTAYNYSYLVQYSITDKFGKTVLPTNVITVNQTIDLPPNTMITGNATTTRVQNFLRTQVLQLLMTELTTEYTRNALNHASS